MGSHIVIWYVPFRLSGLLLCYAWISLLSWTYFFQNKVLKVWRSFIIIIWVSDVYSMLTRIENQNDHQTLHFSVEVVVLILIHLDCTVVGHLLCYFLETEVMCCLRFLWWCCLLWCDTMQSPKKIPKFWRRPLPPSLSLRAETPYTSKMLLFCHITWHHISDPECYWLCAVWTSNLNLQLATDS